MKPDEPISMEKLITFFRSDQYSYDHDFDFEDYRVVSRESNMETHIFDMGETESTPWQVGVVMWVALGPAKDSVYLPFHGGLERSPEGFTVGTDVYDSESASWAFRSVSALARNNIEWRKRLQDFWSDYQKILFDQEKKASEKALDMWNSGDHDGAVAFLSERDIAMAERAVEVARSLESQLITALAQGDDGDFQPKMEDFE
jgi:dipeptidase